MSSERRTQLALVGVRLSVVAICWLAAYLLPESGLLGVVGSALMFVGGVVAVGLFLPIWRVVAPEAAARWEAKPNGRPVPLISPIFFWLATIVFAWILLSVEPPETAGDRAAMVFMWCVAAGAAAFDIAVTRMYIQDRRRRAD
jgi:hypothetical protein